MKGSRKALSLTLVLMVSVGIGGCASNQGSTQGNPEPGSLHLDRKTELAIPSGGSRVRGENACRRATSQVGADAETIEFTVHCSGRKRGKVFFTLRRVSPQSPDETLEINNYDSSPAVRGDGATGRAGRCSMDHKTLACNATIDGSVLISGKLAVRPETRCEGAVAMVGITSPSCEGKHCVGDPILDELFYARPRGCRI